MKISFSQVTEIRNLYANDSDNDKTHEFLYSDIKTVFSKTQVFQVFLKWFYI